jgi:hypothetical protein
MRLIVSTLQATIQDTSYEFALVIITHPPPTPYSAGDGTVTVKAGHRQTKMYT